MSTALRSRWIVGKYGTMLAVLLVILGLVGIGTAAVAYTTPQYENTTRQAHPQTIGTEVRTSATVTGNSSLYNRSDVLEDKPVYLLSASPELNISIGTDVPDDVVTQLNETLFLELEGTKDGETFWEEDRTLINRSRRVNGSADPTIERVNISNLDNELGTLRSEVGQVGVFSQRLRLVVEYSTNRYTGSLSASAPLQITDRAYWIGGTLQDGRTHTTPDRNTVKNPPTTLSYVGPGLAGIAAFVLAGFVLYTARNVDPTAIETAMDRLRYEEWISSGEFPTGPNKRHIRITDLEDLVDVAIDSNKRVIFDDAYQVFAVADGDLVYYFAENPERVEGWLDL